jgi:hypothetical protein
MGLTNQSFLFQDSDRYIYYGKGGGTAESFSFWRFSGSVYSFLSELGRPEGKALGSEEVNKTRNRQFSGYAAE